MLFLRAGLGAAGAAQAAVGAELDSGAGLPGPPAAAAARAAPRAGRRPPPPQDGDRHRPRRHPHTVPRRLSQPHGRQQPTHRSAQR